MEEFYWTYELFLDEFGNHDVAGVPGDSLLADWPLLDIIISSHMAERAYHQTRALRHDYLLLHGGSDSLPSEDVRRGKCR